MQDNFDDIALLNYMGISQNSTPLPSSDPISFLKEHIHQLPPNLAVLFSLKTTPQQRTVIPAIRNRRLKFTTLNPRELSFVAAKSTWPLLWQGRERRGQEEAKAEREWAQKDFLKGSKQHVGKLGTLLGDYEEEREAERVRVLRRENINNAGDDFVPEEDESESDEEDNSATTGQEEESAEEAKASFERLIRERFIYGLLEGIDYDSVDWNEQYDEEDERDIEDRWFNEDSD
ncbi:hypothetical protein SERLA73DRAFT_190173 [Serpula lacrymans var. lacrymans S7.3]|uniref:CCD97-like C-terminal domain-containing protein n=2 Tax=Serpula lacrymans var. lacrymans TaxID=341189 RepID=F8QF70_SERL3|nr:uncharacterized protein SERLADRAFT_414104 [Serpula lacrymans var. lacrymans S7.9]EGN93029.1 hypothetical protein SERLA73DRAFT_190173 [Serpula lacrymans var. lacrymans S7.3]EGO27867.1 hypothetical protein SERLADRAFT_414104 [Serpula lacrymans var. lacrymans S7.9]